MDLQLNCLLDDHELFLDWGTGLMDAGTMASNFAVYVSQLCDTVLRLPSILLAER